MTGTTPEEKEGLRNLVFIIEISRDGDTWKQVVDINGDIDVHVFKSGEPFSYKSFDGKTNMRSTITVRSDKFIERMGKEQGDGSYKEWVIVRERDGEMVTMTYTYMGVVHVIKMKQI